MKHASALAKGSIVAVALVLASAGAAAADGPGGPHMPMPPTPPGPPGTVMQIATVQIPPNAAENGGHGNLANGFDISWVDPATQMLYVADHGQPGATSNSGGIDVVNAKTDSFVGVLGAGDFAGNGDASLCAVPHGSGGPNGVLSLSVGGQNQVWAGNGVTATSPTSNVEIFDVTASGAPTSATEGPTAVINTAGSCRSDELAYDPVDHIVAMANDADTPPYLSFISVHANPANDVVLGTLKFPAASDGIEQTIWNPANGLFYTNIPQVTPPSTSTTWVGNVDEISPTSETVVKSFPVTACSPGGLALNVQQQTLLLGCSSDAPASGLAKDVTMLMDARNGRILSTVTQVGGSDEVWYDSGNHTYYTASSNNYSNGDPATGYSAPVLGVIGANGRWLQNFTTRPAAHSVAANSRNNHVFVPIQGYGIAVMQGSGPVAPFPGPGPAGHGPGH